MNYCPTCGRHHDEREKFCDQDGTPLVELETAADRSVKVSRWGAAAVALLTGAAVCGFMLAAYFYLSGGHESPPQSNQQLTAAQGTAAPRQSVVPPTTPTPEATPTPEPSPTPTPTPPTPPATPEPPASPLAALSDSPASTSGSPAQQLLISLDDGTRITADDAWRARDGVWYRRGGMVSLVEANRIRSIERRQQPPPPTPEP